MRFFVATIVLGATIYFAAAVALAVLDELREPPLEPAVTGPDGPAPCEVSALIEEAKRITREAAGE